MRLRRVETALRQAFAGPAAFVRATDPPRLLIAVSGGADSTALLVGLASLARELGIEPVAAHLHHGLRGAAADADQAFVRGLCAAHGVPLVTARWDCRARMARHGLRGQAGLRVLRRAFLLRALRRSGAAAIATAHTADDQLETLLMRLGRGAGLAGLGGMRPRRGRWLKPMLEVTRSAIEQDLRTAGLQWRDDDSNASPGYLRNRIRHAAIPALTAALWPGGEPSRARELLARHAVALAREARSAAPGRVASNGVNLRELFRISKGVARLDSRRLASYPDPVQYDIVRRAWRAIERRTSLGRTHVDAIRRVMRGEARCADLPGHRQATRRGAGLWIGPVHDPTTAGPRAGAVTLAIPGAASRNGTSLCGCWTTGAAARRGLFTRGAGDEYFAASGLRGALQLRCAEDDETFVPFGHARPTRVRDFVRRQRVPETRRRRPTVFADAGGILWVVGVRRAERARISTATRKALRVHAECP